MNNMSNTSKQRIKTGCLIISLICIYAIVGERDLILWQKIVYAIGIIAYSLAIMFN